MSTSSNKIELKPLIKSNNNQEHEQEEEEEEDFIEEELNYSSKSSSSTSNTFLSNWPNSQAFLKSNDGFMLIGLSQAFFASINCLIKVLQNRIEIPVWQIIVVRMSVTGLGCLLYMLYTGIEHPYLGPPGVRLLLAARGAVGFFGLFGVYFSLRYLSLSDATVLTFLAPVLVGVLASILLKEPYSKTELITGLGSLFGVVLIAKPDFLSFIFGERPKSTGPGGAIVTPEQRSSAIVLALAGVFGAAGAYLLIRKIGKRASALHSISFFSAYCVIICSLYPIFFNSPPVFIFDWEFFILIVPIGFLGFFAQVFLTLGLQRENAGRGTLAVYSNLIFAIILEMIVFGKLPDGWSLIGSFIIVGGAIWVALEKQSIPSSSSVKVKKSDESNIEEGEIFNVDREEENFK